MRAKRSKDARLVEKFGKQKDNLAAEAPLQQPVCSSTTDDKMAYTVADDDDDDDDLKVRKTVFYQLDLFGLFSRLMTTLDVDYDHLTCSSICCHQEVFSAVVGGKRRGLQGDREDWPKNKKSRQSGKDEEYYIPYRPKDFNSERG